jgi:hypothetical protein
MPPPPTIADDYYYPPWSLQLQELRLAHLNYRHVATKHPFPHGVVTGHTLTQGYDYLTTIARVANKVRLDRLPQQCKGLDYPQLELHKGWDCTHGVTRHLLTHGLQLANPS